MHVFPRLFRSFSRPAVAVLAVVALVIAELAYLGLGPAHTASAAPGQGSAFDCYGGTIYTVQRGSGVGAHLTALDTSTLNNATMTNTRITDVPNQAAPNALAITQGGAAAYTVQAQPTGSTVPVYRYDAASQVWTTDNNGTAVSGANFVAGAYDPFNKIYYYATYSGTTSPGTATIYGYNTVTNTPIAGVIATVNLPITDTTGGANGDMAFDQGGNLYLVESIGSEGAVGVVPGPLPSQGGTNPVLPERQLKTYALSGALGFNGIAFDNFGRLYVEYTSSPNTFLEQLNPNTGDVLAGPTNQGLNTSDGTVGVDLAACSLNPTLKIQTSVTGRALGTDQFGMAVTGSGVTQANTATTTGSANGVQSAVAGPVVAVSTSVSGTTYHLAQTATNSDLNLYNVSYQCTDAAASDRVVASGTGASFDFTFPDPAGGSTGPYVTCTFTDTPTPAALDTVKTVASVNGGSPSGHTGVNAGDVLVYNLTTKNTGGTQATANLTDTVPANTTYTGAGEGWTGCTSGATAGTACTQAVAVGPGATVTKTFTVTVGSTPTTTIRNTATSDAGCSSCTAIYPTDAVLNTTKTIVTVNGNPATSSTPLKPGDVVVYTDTTTNTGGTAANVTLSDPVPTNTSYSGTGQGWSCASGSAAGTACTQTATVAADSSVSRNYTVTVNTPLPANTTTITSTVSATAGTCTGCSVTNPTAAALDTVKTLYQVNGVTPTGSVVPGDTLTYRLTVKNTGGSAGSTTLGDAVPANTTYTGTGEGWSCALNSTAGTPCTQDITNLIPGATLVKTYTVKVVKPLPQGDVTITNTATSSGGTCSACSVSTSVAAVLDTVKTLVTVNGASADSSTQVKAGDVLVYDITTTNSGGSSAGTTLTDVVAANTHYTGTGEGWSCTAPAAPGTSCAESVTVPAGSAVVTPYTVTVDNPLTAGVTTINASVTSSNGTCSACSVSNPTVAVLDTTKTIVTVNGNAATSSTQLEAGDVVVYHDTVTNTGGSSASTVLSDPVPANTRYTGAPAQGWSCSAPAAAGTSCTQTVTVGSGATVSTDYTLTVVNPLPTGTQSVTSTVTTGTGTCSACSVSNPTAAVLDTVKTIVSVNGNAATAATALAPGDVVVYRDTVTDTGGSSAVTVLSDPVPANTTYSGAGQGWSCAAGAAAGGSCTQSVTVAANASVSKDYTVTLVNPLQTGTQTITSTVTSGVGTCSACSVSNPTVAALTTAKTIVSVNGHPATAGTALAPGDVVVYRDTVTNTGGTSASTLLTDTVPAATTFSGSPGEGWTCLSGAPPGTGCVQSVPAPANASTSVDFTVTVAQPIPTGTQSITSTVTTDTGACSACTVSNPTVAELDTTKTLVSVNGDPADASTQIKAGDVLVYSVTVTNTGGTAGTTTVSDPVPANTTYTGDASEGWSCPAGSAAGTSCTQTFTVPADDQQQTTYTVTVGTLPPGTTTVGDPISTSTGTCTGCGDSNPTVPALTTTLTLATVNGHAADSNTTVKAGDALGYQLVVHNTGGSTGTTMLSDPVPANTAYTGTGQGWSCAAGAVAGTSCTQDVTLGAGATSTVAYTVTVDQPLAAGTQQIVDQATSSSGSCDCSAQNATVAVLTTTLAIRTVDGDPANAATPLQPGDVVVYGITVTNSGGTDASTNLVDKVPADTTYTGTGEGWTCPQDSAGSTCTQSVPVSAGTSVDLTYTVTVADPIPTGTQTIADAVTTSTGTCTACSASNPTVAQLATVKKLSRVNGDPVVVGSVPALHAGDVATYSITVTDTGGTAGSTNLTETVPANTTYTGTGEGWNCAGTTAASQCLQTVTAAADNGSTTVEFTVTVSNLPRGTQQIENTVLSSAGDCSQCTVDTATYAALDTVKTLAMVNGKAASAATRLAAGDVAQYQITVTNTGGSTGTTTLLESVPDETSYTGTNEGWNCASGTCAQALTVLPFGSDTVSFTVTVDRPLSPGTQQITNTVTSSVGTCSSCTVANPTVGALDTVKELTTVNGDTAPQGVRVRAGDVLGYTITVTNSGGSLASTVVTDSVPKLTTYTGKHEGWSCAAPADAGTKCSLNVTVHPGRSVTRAFEATVVTPLETTAEAVVNTASVSAGTCSSCTVSTPLQRADVVVSKTADTRSASVGDVVGFTVKAHNNGPDAATDLAVTDTPDGMEVVSSHTGTGTFDEDTGAWRIGTLPSGDTVVLHTRDRITAADASNAANATNPDQVDPDPDNGVASVRVHRHSADSAANASGANDLASTGVPTENLLQLASLLMLLGIGVLVLSRRRYRGRRRA